MTSEMILTKVSIECLEARFHDIVDKVLQKHLQHLTGPKQPEDILSREQAAEMLGISLQTLNVWTKAGTVEGYRIGTRVRYKRSELENALTKIKSAKTIQ